MYRRAFTAHYLYVLLLFIYLFVTSRNLFIYHIIEQNIDDDILYMPRTDVQETYLDNVFNESVTTLNQIIFTYQYD